MKDKGDEISQLIQSCEDSILSDIDFKKTLEIQSSVLTNTQKVINNRLIPEIIDREQTGSDAQTKERTRYALTLEIDRRMESLSQLYIPEKKVEFRKFERLSLPAFIGAILFGLLFYYAFGSFFKEALYSPLIGMPIGAGFFVWLFSKAIRHPVISKLIKWGSLAGLAAITIGAVFSSLKKAIIFKPRISFLQWIWLAILTVFIFWILHLFKPKKVENIEETQRCLQAQLKILLYDVYEMSKVLMNTHTQKPILGEGSLKKESSANMPFKGSPNIAASVQQMIYASNSQDNEAAMLSVNSFLNSLYSLGIYEKNRPKVFKFTKEDAKFYDSFGIIHDGDMVEQLYSSWVDDQDRCVFKGKVKKVKR